MRALPDSTIAMLVFPDQPDLNLAHLLAEFEARLSQLWPGAVRLTWSSDEAAAFDIGHARLLVAVSERPRHGHAAALLLGVGSHPEAARPALPARLTQLRRICADLAARLLARAPDAAALWHRGQLPLDTDLAEDQFDLLPSRAELERAQETRPRIGPRKLSFAHLFPDVDWQPDAALRERPALPLRLTARSFQGALLISSRRLEPSARFA